MRAVVLTAPYAAEVVDVPAPRPGPGEAVVDVERAGVCGTDAELWTGEMSYLRSGLTAYPIRPGHEWCGRVREVGPGVDGQWVGRRVVGDTMIGCGHCERCRGGRHHVCADRWEVGILGCAGALAEQLLLPVRALLPVPESLSPEAGALVEPGGGALRAVRAAGAGEGTRLLVLGAGSIGLLALLFGRAAGAVVTVCDVRPDSLDLAQRLGAHAVSPPDDLVAAGPYDAVVDASTGAMSPVRSVELVEPAGRIAWIGIAPDVEHLDPRTIVLKDLTVTGILGASAGLAGAIEAYGNGSVVPDPLVGDVVGLDQVGPVLDGRRGASAGPGPKVLVDPRIR